MTHSADWYNIKYIFLGITLVVVVVFCFIFLTYKTHKAGSRLYFSPSNCATKFCVGFILFWIVFSITFYSIPVCLSTLWSSNIFFYSVQYAIFIIFVISFVLFRFATFTPVTVPIFLALVFTKKYSGLFLSTLATLLVHLDIQRKMPLASWVKHETKGRVYFNTLCACLTQTH